MNLAVVAATKEEIGSVIEFLDDLSGVSGSFPNYASQAGAIDVLITGVGITATSFHLGKAFQQQSYDLAINCGIAGVFEGKGKIGEVMVVETDRFGDLGAEDGSNFLTAHELGLSDFDTLSSSSADRYSALSDLKRCSAITVNTVHGESSSIEKAATRFDAALESMEGAAFAYACQQSNVDHIQIRAISNLIETRNKDNWEISSAIFALDNVVTALIKELIEAE